MDNTDRKSLATYASNKQDRELEEKIKELEQEGLQEIEVTFQEGEVLELKGLPVRLVKIFKKEGVLMVQLPEPKPESLIVLPKVTL